MNANTITDAIATATTFKVSDIVAATGVSETTVRKHVKEALENGTVEVYADGGKGVFRTVQKAAPTGKKAYRKNPDAIRVIRKNRYTKFDFTVQSLDELAVKDPFGHKAIVEEAIGDATVSAKWITVCLEHGTYTGSEFILDAWWKGTHPAHCKDCRKLLTADVIAAAKNLPSQRDDEDEDEGEDGEE